MTPPPAVCSRNLYSYITQYVEPNVSESNHMKQNNDTGDSTQVETKSSVPTINSR
ncbi:unnamed protein product, partial [Sphenostylis stenocarpa]